MSQTDLAQEPYVSFATFRRNGDKVATPVWVAGEGDALYIFSEAKAGKVKRIRNSPRSELAPCTFNGTVEGEWVPAEAVLIDGEDEIQRALVALRKKYGWQMRLADIGAKLTGRYNARAYIRVQVTDG